MSHHANPVQTNGSHNDKGSPGALVKSPALRELVLRYKLGHLGVWVLKAGLNSQPFPFDSLGAGSAATGSTGFRAPLAPRVVGFEYGYGPCRFVFG